MGSDTAERPISFNKMGVREMVPDAVFAYMVKTLLLDELIEHLESQIDIPVQAVSSSSPEVAAEASSIACLVATEGPLLTSFVEISSAFDASVAPVHSVESLGDVSTGADLPLPHNAGTVIKKFAPKILRRQAAASTAGTVKPQLAMSTTSEPSQLPPVPLPPQSVKGVVLEYFLGAQSYAARVLRGHLRGRDVVVAPPVREEALFSDESVLERTAEQIVAVLDSTVSADGAGNSFVSHVASQCGGRLRENVDLRALCGSQRPRDERMEEEQCFPVTIRELFVAVAVSLCLHVSVQPMLEYNQGPQALFLTSSMMQCYEVCEVLHPLAAILHLVVHNAFAGFPVVEQSRRPDIVVGTPLIVCQRLVPRTNDCKGALVVSRAKAGGEHTVEKMGVHFANVGRHASVCFGPLSVPRELTPLMLHQVNPFEGFYTLDHVAQVACFVHQHRCVVDAGEDWVSVPPVFGQGEETQSEALIRLLGTSTMRADVSLVGKRLQLGEVTFLYGGLHGGVLPSCQMLLVSATRSADEGDGVLTFHLLDQHRLKGEYDSSSTAATSVHQAFVRGRLLIRAEGVTVLRDGTAGPVACPVGSLILRSACSPSISEAHLMALQRDIKEEVSELIQEKQNEYCGEGTLFVRGVTAHAFGGLRRASVTVALALHTNNNGTCSTETIAFSRRFLSDVIAPHFCNVCLDGSGHGVVPDTQYEPNTFIGSPNTMLLAFRLERLSCIQFFPSSAGDVLTSVGGQRTVKLLIGGFASPQTVLTTDAPRQCARGVPWTLADYLERQRDVFLKRTPITNLPNTSQQLTTSILQEILEMVSGLAGGLTGFSLVTFVQDDEVGASDSPRSALNLKHLGASVETNSTAAKDGDVDGDEGSELLSSDSEPDDPATSTSSNSLQRTNVCVGLVVEIPRVEYTETVFSALQKTPVPPVFGQLTATANSHQNQRCFSVALLPSFQPICRSSSGSQMSYHNVETYQISDDFEHCAARAL